MKLSFLGTPALLRLYGRTGDRFKVCKAESASRTSALVGRTTMIQSPDSDGPPGLDDFLDSRRQQADLAGEPVTLGTGRANKNAFDGDSRAAVLSALEKAKSSLGGEPQLCHCTVSLDVDKKIASDVLTQAFSSNVAILGRTVNKKESAGNIEILLLRSDSPGGITFSVAAMTVNPAGGPGAADIALTSAIHAATAAALSKLDSASPCTFMVYSHTPGTMGDAGRLAINEAGGGIFGYGGPAVGDAETGAGWGLLGPAASSDDTMQTAVVAAVPGKLSFLLSSVVKNWAQPAFTEPLSFMAPTYVDEPTDS